MNNNALNNVNNQLRDHSRWLKDYKANPEQYGSSATKQDGTTPAGDLSQLQQLLGAGASNSMASMMQMMMLMMMFQMIGGGQLPVGSALPGPSSSNLDLLQSLPGYYPLPNNTASTNLASQKAIDELKSHLGTPPNEGGAIENLLSDWEAAGLNDAQLGQAAMYLLHQGDGATAEALTTWLPALFQMQILNPVPFMQASYVDKLTPERATLLAQSIADAGLTNADGLPQSELIAQLINRGTVTPNNQASVTEQAVARDIVSRLWEKYPDDLYTQNLLQLSGFYMDENGNVLGPYDLKHYIVKDTETEGTTV